MGQYSKVIILLLSLFVKFVALGFFVLAIFQESEFVFIVNPLSGLLVALCWYRLDGHVLRALTIFTIDALLPVFGFVGIMLFFILHPVFKRIYADHNIDVYDLPLGEETYKRYSEDKQIIMNQNLELSKEARLYESFHIEPYIDILEGENLNLKINAIEKLSHNFTADSVSILKHALDGEEYEVRYFANNSLEKIEKTLLEKIEVVSEEIQRQPGDYILYNQRAGFYLDTFLIGVLDESMGNFFLEKSLYDFIFSLQLKANQSYLYVKMVQIHLLLKDYREVVSLANQALKTVLTEEDKAKIVFFRAEANFFLRNFKKVQEDCLIVEKVGVDYQKIIESTSWWNSIG